MSKKIIQTNYKIDKHNIMYHPLYFSRKNLSKVFKLAHIGPWIYNFQTNLFEFNDDFYKIYGTNVAREGSFMSSDTYIKANA